MGHGLAAAALMGQLRNSLRAFALDGHSPAGMLERLDRVVSMGDGMATVVCLVIEPDLRSMRLASAGASARARAGEARARAASSLGLGSVPAGRGTRPL